MAFTLINFRYRCAVNNNVCAFGSGGVALSIGLELREPDGPANAALPVPVVQIHSINSKEKRTRNWFLSIPKSAIDDVIAALRYAQAGELGRLALEQDMTRDGMIWTTNDIY